VRAYQLKIQIQRAASLPAQGRYSAVWMDVGEIKGNWQVPSEKGHGLGELLSISRNRIMSGCL